jgi:hypothetical protein
MLKFTSDLDDQDSINKWIEQTPKVHRKQKSDDIPVSIHLSKSQSANQPINPGGTPQLKFDRNLLSPSAEELSVSLEK